MDIVATLVAPMTMQPLLLSVKHLSQLTGPKALRWEKIFTSYAARLPEPSSAETFRTTILL